MTPPPPWVYLIGWPDLSTQGATVELAPDEATRANIADSLGVETIGHLSALLALRPWLDGVEIEGRVEASVTRICGITLEPFEEPINEPLVVRIVPAGSPNAPVIAGRDVELDLDADDPPDVVFGDTVDLAVYVVEHLALALSPFPRKLGAVFAPPPTTESTSPFAVLARLKPGPKT